MGIILFPSLYFELNLHIITSIHPSFLCFGIQLASCRFDVAGDLNYIILVILFLRLNRSCTLTGQWSPATFFRKLEHKVTRIFRERWQHLTFNPVLDSKYLWQKLNHIRKSASIYIEELHWVQNNNRNYKRGVGEYNLFYSNLIYTKLNFKL